MPCHDSWVTGPWWQEPRVDRGGPLLRFVGQTRLPYQREFQNTSLGIWCEWGQQKEFEILHTQSLWLTYNHPSKWKKFNMQRNIQIKISSLSTCYHLNSTLLSILTTAFWGNADECMEGWKGVLQFWKHCVKTCILELRICSDKIFTGRPLWTRHSAQGRAATHLFREARSGGSPRSAAYDGMRVRRKGTDHIHAQD